MLQAGVEDVAIIACPDVSLFVHSFLRHMHFLKVTSEITPQGTTGFNRKITIPVPKQADLLAGLTYVFVRPGIEADTAAGSTAAYWTNSFGHAVILQQQFFIGGQSCQTLYGEWMELQAEANRSASRPRHETIGTRNTQAALKNDSLSDRRYFVNSQLWFTKAAGLALPLVSVAYQSVKVELTTRQLNEMIVVEGNSFATPLRVGQKDTVKDTDLSLTCYIDTIYLTQEEREAILERESEYLFEEVQTNGSETVNVQGSAGQCSVRVSLDFQHLVRDLYWTIQQECKNQAHNWFSYEGLGGLDPMVSADLRINNSSFLGNPLPAGYFRIVEWENTEKSTPRKYYYKKSFGLKSYGTQPFGHLNFTKTDNNWLNLYLQAGLGQVCITVWAKGWNCMRFSGGVAGPLFC